MSQAEQAQARIATEQLLEHAQAGVAASNTAILAEEKEWLWLRGNAFNEELSKEYSKRLAKNFDAAGGEVKPGSGYIPAIGKYYRGAFQVSMIEGKQVPIIKFAFNGAGEATSIEELVHFMQADAIASYRRISLREAYIFMGTPAMRSRVERNAKSILEMLGYEQRIPKN